MSPQEALELRFECRDLDREVSIREYFKELLNRLFSEGERFSGKRPFGNSGWEYDIIAPLIKAELIKGSLDDEGCVETFDRAAYELVFYEMLAAL